VVNSCWFGLFLDFFNWGFVMLFFLSVLILGLIFLSESLVYLKFYSLLLIIICVIFFMRSSVIFLFLFLELSLFPIMIIILGFGKQIEKLSSVYYLIFYGFFCSIPFIFVYFKSSFFVMVGFDMFVS